MDPIDRGLQQLSPKSCQHKHTHSTMNTQTCMYIHTHIHITHTHTLLININITCICYWHCFMSHPFIQKWSLWSVFSVSICANMTFFISTLYCIPAYSSFHAWTPTWDWAWQKGASVQNKLSYHIYSSLDCGNFFTELKIPGVINISITSLGLGML